MAEFTSAVAIDFANAYPDRIRSLTMPGFGYNYRDSKIDRSEWVRLAEQEGALAWARATNKYRLPADAPQAMRDWYINEQARMPGWFLGALFRWTGTLDLSDMLPTMKVPTLIIAGSDARQGTIQHAYHAARVIPDCRLAVLDGMPFNVMSAAPARCVQETMDFIAAVRERRS
jgi:pimeloyl-ACP methyl ester carboxylesterase